MLTMLTRQAAQTATESPAAIDLSQPEFPATQTPAAPRNTPVRTQTPDWWNAFWERHFQNTGQSRDEAMQLLRRLLGDHWAEKSLADAESAISKPAKG